MTARGTSGRLGAIAPEIVGTPRYGAQMQAVAGDRAAARVITSAALRAAVAWTRREEEPRAWRELSRMTGVLMYALGPGQGPSTPLEVVELLRHPLAKLLGSAAGIGGLGDLVFLDEEDQLTTRGGGGGL